MEKFSLDVGTLLISLSRFDILPSKSYWNKKLYRCMLRGFRLHRCPFWIRPSITVSNHNGIFPAASHHIDSYIINVEMSHLSCIMMYKNLYLVCIYVCYFVPLSFLKRVQSWSQVVWRGTVSFIIIIINSS